MALQIYKKLKFLVILTLSLDQYLCYSQNDTIYIYETVIEYDTIYVTKKPEVVNENQADSIEINVYDKPNMNLLQVDPISNRGNLLIISEDLTATIPIKHIILNENLKNIESMKKLNFFGIVDISEHIDPTKLKKIWQNCLIFTMTIRHILTPLKITHTAF